MSEKISIVVLEDEKNYRDTIKLLLNFSNIFCCLQTYETIKKFYRGFDDIDPDIFWIDLNLPDGSGIDVIRHIKKYRPDALCMVCSFFDSEEMVFKALQNGADGYLLKGESNKKILEALQDLYNGGAPMSSTIAKKVIMSFQSYNAIQENFSLTIREKEILEHLSNGEQYKEIGGKLNVSIETIKKHIKNIYNKLHVNNRTEAVNKYYGLK
ncbi:LuxR C-terminal-related transcriptional regulator [Myroides indicus]|uniref:LuxR family two component transcriptional regulator n=1 Tax=Myroides indicus TaxID=1323422 RepID=A0A4R7F3S6_9FLAO|nr:response regulator transcription factor [Myroides indicus]TDS65086.1 LuxR family two component transcriptional regulator [Myroides indicus]